MTHSSTTTPTSQSPTQRKPRITIRLSRWTLSFSAVDPQAENKVAFTPYTMKGGMSAAANLREALKSHIPAAAGQNNATVMMDAPVLMVPAETFTSSTRTLLYAHAFPSHAKDAVMHTVLPTLGAVAVFGVNKDVRTVIADNFASATYMPVCSPVWSHLYRRSFTGPRRKLYGYCHDKKAEVFSFSHNRFRFCNTFDANNQRDIVYFLLYVWKQTGMDQQRDELHIVGDIPEAAETLATLRKYVRNAYAINPAADFNRSPVTRIEGMPYDLMTLYAKGR